MTRPILTTNALIHRNGNVIRCARKYGLTGNAQRRQKSATSGMWSRAARVEKVQCVVGPRNGRIDAHSVAIQPCIFYKACVRKQPWDPNDEFMAYN